MGKSTLSAILLRLLTGPDELPKPGQDGDLGEVEPEPSPLDVKKLFTSRVADDAVNATAAIQFAVGNSRVRIRRRLSDLSLVEFKIDEQVVHVSNKEKAYQTRLTRLIEVGSFFDVLLILRYVVFLLEDRRALVWGATSQREILRALFIPPKIATQISKLRYDMLSRDSAFRNMRAVLNRRIRENEVEISKLASVSGAKAQMRVLQAELDSVRKNEDDLQKVIGDAEKSREEARLSAVNAALERDSAIRELDRAKVHVLRTKFKTLDDTTIYILSKLAAENSCLACGTHADDLGKQVTDRLSAGRCPVCGSVHSISSSGNVANLSEKQIEQLQKRIVLANTQVQTQEKIVKDATETRRVSLVALGEIAAKKYALNDKVRRLRLELPANDRSAEELVDRNAELQRTIDEEFEGYSQARARFERVFERSQSLITARQTEVAAAFQRYAREFLREKCTISFQPVRVKIGQSGEQFHISLFQLSMGGAAVSGETVRSEPDQVSLSQREFLDLAFRMALMTVAAHGEPSTLVVDAPESSLDFRFAERAGNQLALFSKDAGGIGNRVIVTSNLSNAELIPAFLRGRPSRASAASRVVDLLKLAASNPQIENDRADYEKFLRDQISRAERRT
jgi:hypothetical protein